VALSAESVRLASPESYTPRHLAEKILISKAALEGERKQVTVLFADLKGSLELLADRDPEEARKLLDPVLELMMDAVHRCEGTVNQVMGDGIMALFGAPVAHEDHAVRACYAALRMQESVKRYAEGVRREQGVSIRIRLGLNSGEVVVRAIGSDLHMDYSAVGPTTHLAARMEQLADPGSILLTPDTLALAEGFVQVTSLGPMAVKGLSAPVEVYELTGVNAVRSRVQAAATRGLSRFVGRDAEIEQLGHALARAETGHGEIVAVVGEPGVGKSRLYWEFTHSQRTRGCLILESGSVSYGKGSPYLPVIALLKAYFQIEERDDTRQIRDKVTGKLLSLDRSMGTTLPGLLSLLDIPVEDPQWERLDPVQRRRRILDEVKRLLLRESQAQPLVVLFEDLHWIDTETQALLDSLVESLPIARLLLLVNYRSEYQHSWGSKTYYRQLRIDSLPRESAEALLEPLVGGDASLEDLKRELIERTEGNPLFLEESVRTLVETGALVGQRGAYRLAKTAPGPQVPATVQAILAARIDRLPPEDKRLLQAASVIGKNVPLGLLEAITELPEHEFRRGLARLQAAEFLYERRLFPDIEYTFTHALTHEVAYGGLVQTRRRALHSRILEAVEALYPDRLTERLDELAHHALRGEVWRKALTYLSQAGAKAAARSANREAVACFEKAVAALPHLPESQDVVEQAIDVRLHLRNALLQLGEPERIIDYLREADNLAQALGDKRRLGRVVASMAHYFWLTGDHDRALESGQRALAIAAALDDFPLEVTTNYYLGLAYHSLGQYRRGAEILRRNVESLTGEALQQSFGTAGFHSVFARGWFVWCLAELGEFTEAVACGDEGVRIAEAANEPFSLIQAYLGVGGLHLRAGDVGRAIPPLERALVLCETANIRVLIPRVAASLGHAYTVSDRIAEALPLLERAVQQAFSMPVIFIQAAVLAWLSEAYLAAGRPADAMPPALRALTHARRHKERGNEAWTLRLLAEILARGTPPSVETSEDHYGQAIALAERLEMRPLIAHCHLGLGRLYQRTDPARAREHLATAVASFRELGMRFWLAKADEERIRLP
jgi:class 3 adenylate cyclase/tetratricopeptide (TPR) repeat protein